MPCASQLVTLPVPLPRRTFPISHPSSPPRPALSPAHLHLSQAVTPIPAFCGLLKITLKIPQDKPPCSLHLHHSQRPMGSCNHLVFSTVLPQAKSPYPQAWIPHPQSQHHSISHHQHRRMRFIPIPTPAQPPYTNKPQRPCTPT